MKLVRSMRWAVPATVLTGALVFAMWPQGTRAQNGGIVSVSAKRLSAITVTMGTTDQIQLEIANADILTTTAGANDGLSAAWMESRPPHAAPRPGFASRPAPGLKFPRRVRGLPVANLPLPKLLSLRGATRWGSVSLRRCGDDGVGAPRG